MKEFIWLFGENLGETANNNSFYFWKHVVEKDDGIKKIFILKKNKRNKRIVKSLSSRARKNIVWKNSLEHYNYYKKADMYLVSLSYKDVQPSNIFSKFINNLVTVPTIYLQHGTLGMKRIGYEGNNYNNNMFRFFFYNKGIKEILERENKFRDYQLYYAEFHPRYKELVRKYKEFKEKKEGTKSILWFLTWREYFGDNKETERLIENIRTVVNGYKINEYLKNSGYKLKICLHQFFDSEKIKYITDKLKEDNIEIVTPAQIDVMDEIVKNDKLITDYSSLAFDFTLLGKPVILYQPDIKEYSKHRDFYFLDEMNKYSIKTPTGLAQELQQDKDEVNKFFRNKLPENIDLEYIEQGKHIDRIYENLSSIQKNEITFLGYNFYGKGGTVSATLSLAEGLLEKNYMVKLISLKKAGRKEDFPYGLNIKTFYTPGRRGIQNIFKKVIFSNKKFFSYLKYDNNKENLIPYIGFALKRKLKDIKSNTVVSTRETIHLFLKEANSENIKNKIYFFHTYYKVLQEEFPELIDMLKKVQLEKVVFITEAGKKQYLEKADYNSYDKYEIINNCIESYKMIKREEIRPIQKKKRYDAIYLLRIANDRKPDIDNMISFAKYMKEKNFNGVVIHVYGIGDYLETFLERIEDEKLQRYIKYEGLALDISNEIQKYDLVIDFTLNHSFGMTYLEAILNGKMLFGMINQGSKETLKEISYCYINSYEDLLNKIKNLDKIKLEDLQRNYDVIYNKYSREVITEKFIKYIDS